jgi:hypothetical protein
MPKVSESVIILDREIHSGEPVFRGTRVPFQTLLISYQQNMTGRSVAILILFAKSNRMKDFLPLMPACAEALRSVQPGLVIQVKPL